MKAGDLEGVDPGYLRCDWRDGDHVAIQSGRSHVGAAVADDDRGPTLVGLGSEDRIEIDEAVWRE